MKRGPGNATQIFRVIEVTSSFKRGDAETQTTERGEELAGGVRWMFASIWVLMHH
jgi:hypothetical protein